MSFLSKLLSKLMPNISLYDLQKALKQVPGYGPNKVLTTDTNGNFTFIDKKTMVESNTPSSSMCSICFKGTGSTTDPIHLKTATH